MQYKLLKIGNKKFLGRLIAKVDWLCTTAQYTTITLTDGRVIKTTEPVTLVELKTKHEIVIGGEK